MPITDREGRVWYSLSEASKAWGISRRTLYGYIKQAKLEARMTIGKTVRVPADGIWSSEPLPWLKQPKAERSATSRLG